MDGLAWDGMVVVGRIVRPHGRRGEVVVEAETDFGDERFASGSELFWQRAGRVERVRVLAGRPYDARWVVAFEGVGSIDEAEALRDLEVRIPAAGLHELADGAYYTHDLVGCLVVTGAGGTVGEVTSVMFGTGVPLLAVRSAHGEVLVPLAEPICRSIDTAGRRIVIDPPEGLLELNAWRGSA